MHASCDVPATLRTVHPCPYLTRLIVSPPGSGDGSLCHLLCHYVPYFQAGPRQAGRQGEWGCEAFVIIDDHAHVLYFVVADVLFSLLLDVTGGPGFVCLLACLPACLPDCD